MVPHVIWRLQGAATAQPDAVSHRTLNREQFAGWIRPGNRLAEIPEREDRPMGSEAAFGRRPQDIAVPASAYIAHHPYDQPVPGDAS
jgi:hypothetical protein